MLASPQLLRGRRRRVGGALAVAVALFVVAWGLTGELAAASGSNSISRTAASTLRRPYDWVDRQTHGKPTVYLGQGIADQNGGSSFRNRSRALAQSCGVFERSASDFDHDRHCNPSSSPHPNMRFMF